MTTPRVQIIIVAGILGVSVLAGQSAVGVIRARPFPSPQEIANLEARVLQNPEDLAARAGLLELYLDTAPPPPLDSARRAVRLQHILYLVERHPDAALSASKAAYVYRANGLMRTPPIIQKRAISGSQPYRTIPKTMQSF